MNGGDRAARADRRAALGGPPGVRVVQVPCFGPAATAARVTRFDVGQGYPGACVARPFGEAAGTAEVLRTGGLHRGRRLPAEETCAALVRDRRPAGVVDEAIGVPRAVGAGADAGHIRLRPALIAARRRPHLRGSACLVLAEPDAAVTIAVHVNGDAHNAPLADRVRRNHASRTAG